MKKVHLHPRERLRKSAKDNDDVVFVKKVPLHPVEMFKKPTEENNNDDIISAKKFPLHSRERLQIKKKKMHAEIRPC